MYNTDAYATRSLDALLSATITGSSRTYSGRSRPIEYSMRSNAGLQPLVSRRSCRRTGQQTYRTGHSKRSYNDVGLDIGD